MACHHSLLLPESLRDFRVQQGLLSCCSSSFSSSQMCVTFRSVLLKSFEVIFSLCQLGRILTGEHHYAATVFLSVICTNAWLMKILFFYGLGLSYQSWSCLVFSAWTRTNYCLCFSFLGTVVTSRSVVVMCWYSLRSLKVNRLLFVFCFKQSKLPPPTLRTFCLFRSWCFAGY